MADNQGPQIYSPQQSQEPQSVPAPAVEQTQPAPPSPLPPTPQAPAPSPEPSPASASFPSGNPFAQGAGAPQEGPAVPPPPSVDERVGVRTMASDQASIQNSGGQTPQPEIISAPPLSSQQSAASVPSAPTPSPDASFVAPSSVPEPEGTIPAPPQRSNRMKTIFIVAGIVVAAGIVGFGIYYLVSLLSAAPPAPVVSPQQEFPLGDLGLNDEQAPVSEEQSGEEDSVPVLTHSSLLASSSDVVASPMSSVALSDFEAAVTAAVQPSLPDGGVREVLFTHADETPVSAQELLSAYFSSQPALVSLFAPDMTTWLYFDATGAAVATPRFGVVMTLADGVEQSQAATVVANALESSTQEIGAFFVSNMTPPVDTVFDDGVVGDVPVRFLVYGSGRAFEYGWISNASGTHLVLATSYKQMLDATTRISNTPSL